MSKLCFIALSVLQQKDSARQRDINLVKQEQLLIHYKKSFSFTKLQHCTS